MAKKSCYLIKNIKKYNGISHKLKALSSWENKYMLWCDMNDDVLLWHYGRSIVRYLNPFTQNYYRYYIDFMVRHKYKNSYVDMLIEIKPLLQMFPPRKEKKHTSPTGYNSDLKRYLINRSKWIAANEYAINNKMIFYLANYKNNRFIYHSLKEVGING